MQYSLVPLLGYRILLIFHWMPNSIASSVFSCKEKKKRIIGIRNIDFYEVHSFRYEVFDGINGVHFKMNFISFFVQFFQIKNHPMRFVLFFFKKNWGEEIVFLLFTRRNYAFFSNFSISASINAVSDLEKLHFLGNDPKTKPSWSIVSPEMADKISLSLVIASQAGRNSATLPARKSFIKFLNWMLILFTVSWIDEELEKSISGSLLGICAFDDFDCC